MPPRRRYLRRSRTAFKPGAVAQLLTGGNHLGGYGVRHRPDSFRWDDARAAWDDLRDDLLPEWIAEHPGRRPFGWWAFDAIEPRQLLPNTPDLAIDARLWFGLPLFFAPHSCPDAIDRPEAMYETEPDYLERLDLWEPCEREAWEAAQ
jgi:hypothetical protein